MEQLQKGCGLLEPAERPTFGLGSASCGRCSGAWVTGNEYFQDDALGAQVVVVQLPGLPFSMVKGCACGLMSRGTAASQEFMVDSLLYIACDVLCIRCHIDGSRSGTDDDEVSSDLVLADRSVSVRSFRTNRDS